ncbi:MAG: TonB-dependent receptor [Bacteroidota bacterium]
MNRYTTTTARSIAFLACMLFSGFIWAQVTVSGTVKNTDGDVLVGATVLANNARKGVITNEEGMYTLNLNGKDDKISASYLGYATLTVEIPQNQGNTITLNITLEQDKLALEAVVVTGTFSGRSQKESPISMTYLNANQIQNLTANSQADILRTVPGITAEGGGGEVASNVFVRGLPSGGQYQFTPLQVDGMPVLSTFGLNSSAHDVYFRNDIGIRNLEFVRGGASTLFGAGSVAGIINYSSVTGSVESDNRVQLEWADGGRVKADFLSAGPLNENTFYAVSGFYRYDEGPLETGLSTRGYQIRGNLKRIFNDGNSSLTVSGQFIDDNVQFYLPYPLANNNGQKERPIGNDGNEVFTLLTGQAKDFSFDTPFGRFQSPIGDGVTTNGGYVMMDLKHEFADDWRLSAKVKSAKYDHWFNLFLDGDGTHNTPETQASYLEDRALPADATFTYADTGEELAGNDLLFQNRVLDRERPMEEMVGEVNLTKTLNGHQLTLGTFLSDTRAADNNWIWNYVGDFRNAPRMVGVSYMDSTGANINYSTDGFISGAQTANRYHESVKSAIYFADEYKGENFNFDIGFRWERAAGFISRETGIGSNTFQKGEVSASDFAIALAGLYKINKATNVYANFSRGYFFPELRGVKFSSPGEPQTYETEGILQGELGAKYGKGRIAATAAVFLVALDDRRSVDFVNDGSGGVIEEVSVQSTRTLGVEVTLNLNIVSGLDLYGNATFQDHEFTEFEGNPEFVGNRLRRQPNYMGLVGLAYDKNNVDFNISSNFLGSKFANDANTVELDGFNIMRLSAGYRIGLGNEQSLRLGFSIFNLLNAAGVTEGSPRQGNSQDPNGSDYFVGRPILPRRVFLRASFDF